MKDHQWHLRSLDKNFVGVIKLYFVECCKEFGSTIGDRSKNTIQNMFTNFSKVSSCLTHIFEIGAKERESSLVIFPNYKPLVGRL